MKKLLLLLLPLFFNYSFTQTGEITYIVTPTKIDNSNNRLTDTNKEVELMSFLLKYNHSKSYFKKNKNLIIDEFRAKLASVYVGANKVLHQFLDNKQTVYNKQISNKMYQVIDTTLMRNWNLTNETKKIEGYTCYKAELTQFNERAQNNYIITAWYTPEIPAPFGPIGYGGLPGLILELKNKNGFIFSPEKIKLNLNKIKIPELEKGKEITVKEMLLLRRKERKVTED